MSDNMVEAINYENLRINGYNIQSITSLKIKSQINEHSVLNLTGILNNEDINDIYATTGNKKIEVYYNKNGKKTLFYGIVTNVEVKVIDGVYTIKIEAKSMTYLMDIKEKSRSFQNCSLNINSLINLVMSDYGGASYKLNIPNEAVGELMVQFEETDFEFIRRLVSKYNVGIMPDMTSNSIRFIAGPSDKNNSLSTANVRYEIYKDLDEYNEMSKNYLNNASELDFLTYKISDYAVINLGEYISFQNKSFYMYNGTYEIKDGVLNNTYNFRVENGIRQKRLFNTKIIGSALQGKIIGVKNDVVQVHLEIDNNQSTSDAKWFKFSTMSASTDGSGWYCMPEIGDSVKVYFPTKDEDESFAISAVSNYKQGSGEAKDRMGDPSNKYLRTSADKEVRLSPDGVHVSCDSGQAAMKLGADGTLTLSSQGNISINASESIKFDTPKSFKITSVKAIYLACDKNGGINFDESGNIKERGTQVNNN